MTEFAVGESVLVAESLSEYEALRIFFQVADERGHSSPSIVVDDQGQAITHPDYVDRMGVPHIGAGAWAFCRRPAAEALGLPSGTDWVRAHCLHLMFSTGSPYQSTPHFYDQLYVQHFGSAEPQLMIPMCSAHPVAWSNDGSRICVLEERLGHLTDGTKAAKYILWEYELALGHRRLVAGFPAGERLDFVELSYSLDGRWIHICEYASGRNLLVRAHDGLVVTLPVVSAAVAWNPGAGPDLMTVMTPDRESGNLIVSDYDVSIDILTARAEVRSPTGLPLKVRELSISTNGLALVTAPVGSPGVEQLQRGGVQVAAVIDLDEGTIEPALPVRYRTPYAQRRHHSPRWCGDRAVHNSLRTTVADHLLEAAAIPSCEPDTSSIQQDHLQRWLEMMKGFGSAWRAGTMPITRFAQDYAQIAISCTEIDAGATDEVLSHLRQYSDREPAARAILRRISSGYRLGSPLATLTFPDAAGAIRRDRSTQPPLVSPAEVPVAIALERLISADSHGQAASAIQQLLHEAHRVGIPPEHTWHWLASLTSDALGRGDHTFPAKIGLATLLWNRFFLLNDPELATCILGPTPSAAELVLLVNCFEACTHLPERTVLAQGSNTLFDVEITRNWCQESLSRLPLSEYLTNTARPTRTATVPPVLDGPTTERHREAERLHIMSRNVVFFSYVREDSTIVDRIAQALRSHGAEAWLDRTHIIPGERWQRAIRHAIRDGAYFIACFSPSYTQRERTYMNEELRLAIEQMRLMPLSRRWFIPIILKSCRIPDFPIDAVETLENLQYIDFSDDWDTAIAQLISAVSPAPSAD